MNPDHLATRLIGRRIENQDGQRLGQLKDLAIDARSGHALYAIVASGGVLGIGHKLSAVPAGAISSATAKTGVAMVDVSRKRWKNTPPLSGHELADELSEAAFAQETRRLFARSFRESNGSTDGQAPAEPSASPTPTGRTSHGPSRVVSLAHEVIGKPLRDRQDEVIGKIVDVFVDLSGKVTSYAVVVPDEDSTGHEFFALPFPLLHPAHGSLQSDLSPEAFRTAHLFNEPAWIDNQLTVQGLYRIDGTDSGDMVTR